jgi:parallel beta-helix repeat protein
MSARPLAAVLAAVLALPAGPVSAETHRIKTGMDHMEIQEVMDRAAYGDTVLVEPGQYLMLTVRNGIKLIGEQGPENTVFRHTGAVLNASQTDSTTLIQDVTVDGVKASEGIIVAEESDIRIRGCILKNGWVGVRGVQSSFLLEDTEILNCQNGVYLFESEGIVSNCRIHSCITGITLVSSSPRILRNDISRNSLGVSISEHSDPTIGGSLASANRIYGNPGGAVKSTALIKRSSVRTMNLATLSFPYNYWGADCPDSAEIFRGSVEFRPWVDGSGRKSLESCPASADE